MESKMKFEITSSQLAQILAALKNSVVPGQAELDLINQDSSVPALQVETQHSFTAGSTAPVPIRIPPPPPIAPPSFSTIAELKALDSLNSYHSDPDMAAMQIKNFVEECTSQGRQDDPQSEMSRNIGGAGLRPIDLIVAGAEFQRTADSNRDHPLSQQLADSANRLISFGLTGLDANT
jgi:hypothetical protein